MSTSFLAGLVALQFGAAPAQFHTALSLEQMKAKQAVLETSAGRIVIDLLPEVAPNHVGYFIKQATEGGYNGTTFHRAVKDGLVQGGDPLSKLPAKKSQYGTGGLGVLKAEPSAEKYSAGTVAAVIAPGKPDSGGAQFFICVSDQPALEGQYTIFGRVVEGLEVARTISESALDEKGRLVDRIEIKSAVIRAKPPPEPEPFSQETAAQLAPYRVILETTMGNLTLALRPDKAPEHVRNFLRLAKAGVYDLVGVHRVKKGFVIQTGAMAYRAKPLDERQQKLVHNLQPEINDLPHVKGTLSMARGEDPASASTSFFICLAPAPALDGKYTVFGSVVDGMKVLETIELTPVDGETPKAKIEVLRARVEKAD